MKAYTNSKTPKHKIICGDSLAAMRRMADSSIDSVVTDPPYGLSFMNKHWDHSVPSVEMWQEVLRVLKPGGHLLSFFGTRTYHRGVVNIEDAGFDIRDQIAWVYGSGFPKSLNVAKQGDDLSDWDGWGTALKPAQEPIVMARKPIIGTVADNVRAFGAGAINIDCCRIQHDETLRTGSGTTWDAMHSHECRGRDGEASADRRYAEKGGTNFAMKPGPRGGDAAGRWPANFCHDGSDDVLALFPQSRGQIAKASTSNTPRAGQNAYGEMVRGSNGQEPRNDAGSAARFFYCAKASKTDRDEGLEYLAAMAAADMVDREAGSAGIKSAAAGAGRGNGGRNFHPTVKPTDLMRWLVRMVTPPGGTVLDPFMGSGSTGKACALEGFGFIGIDREQSYCDIATGRITHALRSVVRRNDLIKRLGG